MDAILTNQTKAMKSTILITGASSGIGRETAKFFQAKGWNVIATMRQPTHENELQHLENVLVTRLDVLDLISIQTAIESGLKRFGRIDVLLNNAGYGAYGPLESFPRERILRQFHTNVIGLLDVSRAIMPHFRKNKRGILINVSSMGGKVTFPLGSLYHGTKFAVEGLSESLRYELESFGGRVKIIEPGATATEFAGRSFDFCYDESLPEYQNLVDKVLSAFLDMLKKASSSRLVAEVIFKAATDGKMKLRYKVGRDAHFFLGLQKYFGHAIMYHLNKRFFKL